MTLRQPAASTPNPTLACSYLEHFSTLPKGTTTVGSQAAPIHINRVHYPCHGPLWKLCLPRGVTHLGRHTLYWSTQSLLPPSQSKHMASAHPSLQRAATITATTTRTLVHPTPAQTAAFASSATNSRPAAPSWCCESSPDHSYVSESLPNGGHGVMGRVLCGLWNRSVFATRLAPVAKTRT